MIILHGTWLPSNKAGRHGKFFIWGESSKIRKKKNGYHPYQASFEQISNIISSMIASPEDKSLTKTKVSVRLPTIDIPIPSSRLLMEAEFDSRKISLQKWVVEGMRIELPEILDFLISVTDKKVSNECFLGEDILFWGKLSKFGLELLARQRFIPYLFEDKENKYYSSWRSVLNDTQDIERIRLMSDVIPPVCRAYENNDDPLKIIMNFLDDFVDILAREWLSAKGKFFDEDSVDACWFNSLNSCNPSINYSKEKLKNFSLSFNTWISQIYTTDLDQSFRTCFRVEPPDEYTESWKLRYFLQASDDPSLLVPAEIVWKEKKKTLTILKRKFERPQERLLADLGKASNLFKPIEKSLRNAFPTECRLTTDEAYSFLTESSWLLRESGFGVLLPSWWKKKKSGLNIKINLKPSNVSGTGFGLGSFVNFEWKLAVGDEELTEEEFRQLVELKTPLVRVRGEWVEFSEKKVQETLKYFQSFNGRMRLKDVLKLESGNDSILDVSRVESTGWIKELLKNLKEKESLPRIPTPRGFNGLLRPYQERGFSWLHFLKKWGIGSCLADDMGLGKTIQFIALMLKDYDESNVTKPSLLVCPTSVLGNWHHEVKRFSPSIKVMIHHGHERLSKKEFPKQAKKHHLVLTTYSIAQRDVETLDTVEWNIVGLDEAQKIKNFWTKRAKAVKRLRAENRIALTGTPIENRLSELWSIMDFLNPGYLGPFKKFRENYIIPIERYQDKKKEKQLQELIRPFVLRRLKTDPNIVPDLPEKMEMKVYCNLTSEQATLYQAVVNEMFEGIEGERGIKRKGMILGTLTKLKQVCDHPALFLRDDSKIENRSGKFSRLCSMIEEAVDEGDKMLVFTQFVRMGNILKKYLQMKFGQEVLFLHGGIPRKKRDTMIKKFQDKDDSQIFIISLRAGGLGLNLTGANHVFHFDRWWNPAVENQATDRAFRIGQTKNVQVHKFVTLGTVEENIDEMIERKKNLAENIIGTGETWLTEMSTDQLRKVFALREDSIVD